MEESNKQLGGDSTKENNKGKIEDGQINPGDKAEAEPRKQRRSTGDNRRNYQNRVFYNQIQTGHHSSHPKNKHAERSARDKRSEFSDRHSHTHSNSNKWSSDKPGKIDQKTRSLSTTAALNNNNAGSVEGTGEEQHNEKRGRIGQRDRKSATDVRASSNSMSNAESFDYDEMELDEPFSESEDEFSARRRATQKPCLVIPRGRIRSLSGTIPPVGYSPHWGGPTMCLSCLQFFQLPEMITEFSAHLLSEHQIVIDGIEIIVDLKRYIEHWRQQFNKCCIDKVFPKIVPKEGDELFDKVDYYFEMSETVKEDYALRQRLAMRRLEEALACQQRERDDCTFMMQCLFCRYTARGNRSKIIHHLYSIHHLNLGSPDNLVFVTEYIEHLREKITRNVCIYCEKTFSDRNTLMDHMRKKNHKEVNPKNNYYDKFYIINYLELGKRWLDVLAEDFEDTMPTFADSDEEEEEESWHEWQEDNTGEEDAVALCLFCDRTSETLDELVKHMDEEHKFHLIEYFRKLSLDTYGRMKFVNFMRKKKFNTRAEPGSESNKFADIPDQEEWDKEENLVPMFGNDHLLWIIESWFFENDEAKNEPKDVVENAVESKESVVELTTLVEESKKNTVQGVIAEDLPDLTESILANSELQESLR